MATLTGRLKREHATLQCMTEIYCAHHHTPYEGKPCARCEYLLRYASVRLEKCPYGDKKPTCARCPVHCYKKQQRQQVRAIMRFAGPRMTWRHPWRSLTHFCDRFRRVEHPLEMRQRKKNQGSQARDKKADLPGLLKPKAGS